MWLSTLPSAGAAFGRHVDAAAIAVSCVGVLYVND